MRAETRSASASSSYGPTNTMVKLPWVPVKTG